jgi:hypothetical protein
MTPYRANVTLRDAALLCTKLVEAAQGQKPVLQAIHESEEAMRRYAFEAVDASLRSDGAGRQPKEEPGIPDIDDGDSRHEPGAGAEA